MKQWQHNYCTGSCTGSSHRLEAGGGAGDRGDLAGGHGLRVRPDQAGARRAAAEVVALRGKRHRGLLGLLASRVNIVLPALKDPRGLHARALRARVGHVLGRCRPRRGLERLPRGHLDHLGHLGRLLGADLPPLFELVKRRTLS